MKRIYYIVLLAAVVLCGCNKQKSAQRDQAAMKVKTMVVKEQVSDAGSRYVGTVEPAHAVPVSLQSTGRVLFVHAKNGTRLHRGQVILRVDSTQALHAVQSTYAVLQQAQDGYDRARQVYASGAVTDQKMVEVESQLARARAAYETAQQQLRECTLTAPCDGVLSGLDIEPGQTVLPGRTLCSLLDVTGMNVRFTVPEAEIRHIRLQDEGEMTCAAVDTVLPVQVTEKDMTANALTHTYDVTARIIGGSDVLMPGMVATISLQLSAISHQTKIVIPASCVLLKPEGHTVWIKENGKAVRRAITVDGYQADGVRVAEGLQAGDSLITEGYQKLYSGCKVIED